MALALQLRNKVYLLLVVVFVAINLILLNITQLRDQTRNISKYVGLKLKPMNLVPDDIFLMIKGGSSTIYNRVPAYMLYVESNKISNVAIYSDISGYIGQYEVIDILANSSEYLQSKKAFEFYRVQLEHQYNPIELEKLANKDRAGWRLDILKNLPMCFHAYKNWPNLKWYIMTDDDIFFFFRSILNYLSKLDHEKSHYLGISNFIGNLNFVNGGGGIYMSAETMKSFAKLPSAKARKHWDDRSAESLYGDALLAEYLKNEGIPVTGMRGLYGCRHVEAGFNEQNLCEPVYAFHHLTARDMMELKAFEDEFNMAHQNTSELVLMSHVFYRFVDPYLKETREDWDNRSQGTEIKREEKDKDDTVFREDCKKACDKSDTCLQYRVGTENCVLSSEVKMGLPVVDNQKFFSGWNLQRIADMKEKAICEY